MSEPDQGVVGTVAVDDEGIVTHCHEAVADLFDADAGAVVGEPSSALDPDLAAVGNPDEEPRELRRGGHRYAVRVEPLDDREGRDRGRTLVVVDVTDRRRLERDLAEARGELRLVARLNEVVRDVNAALLSGGTREAILEAAAGRLADSDLYDAARAVGGTVPAAASVEGGTTPVTDTGTSGAPEDAGAATAVEGSPPERRRALPVYEDAEAVPVDAAVPADAPEATGGQWTAVPVTHGRTAYGSVALVTTREDAFGDRELAVLEDLGRQVGHAINAAEKERLLVSDAVQELELVATGGDPLAAASRAADCTLRVEGLLPVDRDGIVAYCSVEGTSVHEGFAALSRVDGITRLRPLDDSLVEIQLGEATLVVPLREVGARLETVVAEEGACRVVAQVSPDADVRAVVDRVQRSVPAAELRSKRREENVRTGSVGEPVPLELTEGLTDRQVETLQAAYSAGYFEWPRESSAEDLAEEMGVTSPTVLDHLRKAENAVLRELLEE
jgi:hypothetical protein